MIPGLNVGFSGHLIGRPLLDELYARGVRMVRHDCLGVGSAPDLLHHIAGETLDAGMAPLLVMRPEQCAWLPPVIDGLSLDVEIWNEPDIGTPPTPRMSPKDYANDVNAADWARPGGCRLWAGVISNLDRDSLDWLEASIAAGWPEGVGVSVHRYPVTAYGPEQPQPGFASREAEVDRLKAIIGSRPWAVSEFGHRIGPQSRGCWPFRKTVEFTEIDQARATRFEFDFWERMGATAAIAYQVNSGQGMDRYGWRRPDLSWAPVADVLRTV